MIELKIDGKEFKVPTDYHDMKFAHYAKVMDAKDVSLEEMISLRTTIDIELIKKMKFSQLATLMTFVDYLDEEPTEYTAQKIDMNIGSESYEKLEKSKQAIQRGEFSSVIDMCKTYLDIDISDRSVFDSFGYVAFFLSNSQHFQNDLRD